MWHFMLDWIVPYVRTTQRQKRVDKAYRRYSGWKRYVRLTANTVGIPDELDNETKYIVFICVRWKAKARADIDNCLKGILDALWSQDRRGFEVKAVSVENCEREAVEVNVSEWPSQESS